MRIYIPSTVNSLHEVHQLGEHGPAPVTAFGVTPAIREWYVNEEVEELEYAVFIEAAQASLRLLDIDPIAPRRRLVLSAEVAEERVTFHPELDRAVVRVVDPVRVAELVCIHIDGVEAEEVVSAAAAAVLGAELGEADAEFAVDSAEDFPLEWYDATELDSLIASFSPTTGSR